MADGVQEYVEGLVYRGRPPSSDQPGAWHVEIGRYVDVKGVGRTMLPTLTLTPDQALAAGHSLAGLMDGLNAEALAAAASARAEAQRASVDLAGVVAERDSLQARLDAGAAAATSTIVSDRQFFQALALAGDITETEALAAVMTGTMPARIEAAVAALPTDQQFAARMLLSGATTFDRHHPMVALLGQILGKDAATLDALWVAAAGL